MNGRAQTSNDWRRPPRHGWSARQRAMLRTVDTLGRDRAGDGDTRVAPAAPLGEGGVMQLRRRPADDDMVGTTVAAPRTSPHARRPRRGPRRAHSRDAEP